MAQILADIQDTVSFLAGVEESTKARPLALSQHLDETNQVVRELLVSATHPLILKKPQIRAAIEPSLLTKRDYDRAWFVRLGYECVKRDGLKAGSALISPELSYAADVVLDDIADGGEIRFGKPCLHRNIGSDAAMYVAELLRSLSTLQLMQAIEVLRPSPETGFEILRRNHDAAFRVNCGQFLDVACAGGDYCAFTDDDYIELIDLTTGADVAKCLVIGAMLAGAPHNLVNSLTKAGSLIGILLQVRDDLLDYADSAKHIDKTPGRDLAKLRMRLPFLVAYRLADDRQNIVLRSLVQTEASYDWETMRTAILTPSTTAYVRRLSATLYSNLTELLDSMEILPGAREMIALFSTTVLSLG